jgi:SAM-dependent methyltransferase
MKQKIKDLLYNLPCIKTILSERPSKWWAVKPSPIPRNVRRQDYSSRIEKEIENYKSVENVHDLPPIFHYWSNKYLLPQFRQFGFDSVKEFFCVYLTRICNNSKDKICQFISIGAGNCDTEAEIVETLRGTGIDNFILECVDVNQYMLNRGKVLAQQKNLVRNMTFTNTDINSWRPEQEYHVVIVNQALHHFLELELLFDKIYNVLHSTGYFLTSDMIGRNGHMRWPEALMIVNELWKKLPNKYKYNHQLKHFEIEYDNWNCSKKGFEGIRAQDVLPLLINSKFNFDLFIAFSNAINIFVDRSFGPNFDPNNKWDRLFIDKVHYLDQQYIEKGIIKPTQMIAALTKCSLNKMRTYKHLSPDFCVRWPNIIPYQEYPDKLKKEVISTIEGMNS